MNINEINDYSKVFPIQNIENGFLINGNGDISVGYNLFMPDVFTLSEDDAKEIEDGFIGLLKLLPSGAIIHKQDFFFVESYSQEKKIIENVIHRENMEFYDYRPVLRHYSNIYLTFSNNKRIDKSYNTSLQFGRNIPFTQPFKDVKLFVENANNYIITFENRLNGIKGFAAKKMTNDQLCNALNDYCNLSYDTPSDQGVENRLNPLSCEKDGSLMIGKKHVAILTLVEEGSELHPHKKPKTAPGSVYQNGIQYTNIIQSKTSMVFPLSSGLPINHILNTIIEISDNDKTLDYLNSEKKGLGFLGNFYAPARVKQGVLQNFIDAVNAHGYQTCKTSVNVILDDVDKNSLQRKISNTESAFVNMNQSKCYVENFDTANLFFASMPGNANANYRGFINVTPMACAYLNKESMLNSDPHGFVYTDRFGTPVVVDMWNSPRIVNRNKLILGPSGSGKSYAINNLLNQSLYQGNHVVMIDIGHSYKRSCDLNGGKYFDSSDKKTLSFNIFLCNQDKQGNYIYKDTQDSEATEDKINFIFTVLSDIWKGQEKIQKIEEAMMKKSIEGFYQYVNANKLFPDLSLYYQYLDEFDKTLDADERNIFNVKRIKILMEPFALPTGQYHALLNAKENINIKDDKFIVFDLEDIQNNQSLFSLVSIVIIELVIQKINQLKGVRKSLIIDEALNFLQDPKMGDFIGYLYRTFRKKEGEVYIAAQNVKFLEGATQIVRDSIIINTATIILLDHSEHRSSYKDIQRILSFTDHEIEMLDSLVKGEGYREFYMRMGKHSYILRTEVSDFADSVFTSKESEVKKINELWQEKGNLITAIYQYNDNKKKMIKT